MARIQCVQICSDACSVPTDDAGRARVGPARTARGAPPCRLRAPVSMDCDAVCTTGRGWVQYVERTAMA